MRNAFISALVDIAERDERVVLLTGDLGFTVLEPFAERFPGRFINAGVAEQNMVGVATGMAEAGYTPYVYSIATFASMRAYEFIRNGPVVHQLPVRIVGVGGGLDYGHNGMTHFALEDVAIMRVQPALTVVATADPGQTRTAVPIIQDLPGPVYLRLGKGSADVPGLDGRFELGRADLLGDGDGGDVALVALGPMAGSALKAAELLDRSGIRAAVAVVSSMNPSPLEDLAELLASVRLVLTAEAHYENGAIGSLVAELIAERALGCRLVRAGVRSMPAGVTGSSEYMLERFGLSAERLADTAMQALAVLP